MLVEEIRESLKKVEAKIVEITHDCLKRLPARMQMGAIELVRITYDEASDCHNTYFEDLGHKGELKITRISLFVFKEEGDGLVAGQVTDVPAEIAQDLKDNFQPAFLKVLSDFEAETGLLISNFGYNVTSMDKPYIAFTV